LSVIFEICGVLSRLSEIASPKSDEEHMGIMWLKDLVCLMALTVLQELVIDEELQ